MQIELHIYQEIKKNRKKISRTVAKIYLEMRKCVIELIFLLKI